MKLSLTKRKALLRALLTVQRDGPTDSRLGICWNLQDVLKYQGKRLCTYAFVAKASLLWAGVDPHAVRQMFRDDGSEGVSWPIRRQYDEDGDRLPYWEGEQLCKRAALLEFLIDYLNNYTE